MADVRFLCPECASKLCVDSVAVGHAVDCPVCHKRIQVAGVRLLDIRFRCGSCSGKLVIDRKAAGLSAPCPLCGAHTSIPQFSTEGITVPEDVRENQIETAVSDARGGELITEEELRFLASPGQQASTA